MNFDSKKSNSTSEISSTNDEGIEIKRDSGIIRRKALYVSSSMQNQIQSDSVSSNASFDNIIYNEPIGITSNNTISGANNVNESWKESNQQIKNKFISLDNHMNLSKYNNNIPINTSSLNGNINDNNNNNNNNSQIYSPSSLNRNGNSSSFSSQQYQDHNSYPVVSAVPISISQTNSLLDNSSICVSPNILASSPPSFLVINQNPNNSLNSTQLFTNQHSQTPQNSIQFANGNLFIHNTFQSATNNNMIYGSPTTSTISPSTPTSQPIMYNNTAQLTSPFSQDVRIRNNNKISSSQRYSVPVISNTYSIATPNVVSKSNTISEVERLNMNNPQFLNSVTNTVHQTLPRSNIDSHNTVSLSESGNDRNSRNSSNNGSFCGLSVNGKEYRHSSNSFPIPVDSNNQINSINGSYGDPKSISISIPNRKDSTYFAGTSKHINTIINSNSNDQINDNDLLNRKTLNSSKAFSNFLDSYTHVLNNYDGENDASQPNTDTTIPLFMEDAEGSKSNEKTNISEHEKSNSEIQRNSSTLLGLNIEMEKKILRKRNTLKSKDRFIADEILRKMSISHSQNINRTPTQSSIQNNHSIKIDKNGSVERKDSINHSNSNLSTKSSLNSSKNSTHYQELNNVSESAAQVINQEEQNLLNSSQEHLSNNDAKKDDIDIGLFLFDKFYEECFKRIDNESDKIITMKLKVITPF